jgi:hypothetical protein
MAKTLMLTLRQESIFHFCPRRLHRLLSVPRSRIVQRALTIAEVDIYPTPDTETCV